MTAVPSAPSILSRIPAEDLPRVRRLVETAALADGRPPLGEQVLLRLGPGPGGADSHVLLWVDDPRAGRVLAGYAHLDPRGGQGPVAELVVHPDHRGQGLGTVLVRALEGIAGRERLSLWAHGDGPAARALAARTGLAASRLLHRWVRDLAADLPDPALPGGIRLRTFRPGRDEGPWLALNALAFATHPEQGGWTAEDLRARIAEPWFDPGGFLLAETDGPDGSPVLAGFHWTKIHENVPGLPPGPWEVRPGERIGEVYVVGVHPRHRGHGLGRALTVAGLHRLRAAGPRLAMLYVDGDNHPAQAVYRSLDFQHGDTDVLFVRPAIDRTGPGTVPDPEAPGE